MKESSGSVTLATFKFLGLSVAVSLKYDAASDAEWSMRNGASSGDAGDVYTGLGCFGRLVETIWQAGSTELVHTTYGRNRVGGVTWQRNVLAPAMTGSPLPPERLQQDNFCWYDGLQQNYQHQRGDLAGTAPNYTGITNLQQTEIRSLDEPTGAPRRKTDQARRVGPKGEAKPNQTGNWLSNDTSSPALTQSRTHNKANEIATISGITAPTFDVSGAQGTVVFELIGDDRSGGLALGGAGGFGAGGGGEFGDLADSHGGQAGEDIAQPGEGIQSVAAAGFDEGVKDRGTFPGFGFADEQPVLFADGGGPYRIFDGVVIDADAAVLHEDLKLGIEVEGVGDG